MKINSPHRGNPNCSENCTWIFRSVFVVVLILCNNHNNKEQDSIVQRKKFRTCTPASKKSSTQLVDRGCMWCDVVLQSQVIFCTALHTASINSSAAAPGSCYCYMLFTHITLIPTALFLFFNKKIYYSVVDELQKYDYEKMTEWVGLKLAVWQYSCYIVEPPRIFLFVGCIVVFYDIRQYSSLLCSKRNLYFEKQRVSVFVWSFWLSSVMCVSVKRSAL